MLRDVLTNRLVLGALVFVVLMGVGGTLYLLHVERENRIAEERTAELAQQANEQNRKTATETKEVPPAHAGHFHADGTFHAEPHAPGEPPATAQGRDTVPPDSEAPPPPLTREELPDVLPYPMTLENRHVWEALLTEATTDPALMERLIPDTEEKIYVLLRNLSNSVNTQIDRKVSRAAYRKLHAINPNDWRVLKTLANFACFPFQTREDRLEYIRLMEQAKTLAKAQGIQMTTPHLSFAYRDLGMLEKAVAEGFEQWELLEKLTRERRANGSNQVGLMHIGDVLILEEQLEKQRQSQKNQ